MNEPTIIQLDIKKLFVDYLKTRGIMVNENDIDVLLSSLEVIQESAKWTHIANNDSERTVTVKIFNRRVGQGDSKARVYVQERDNFCRITFDNLVIAGLPEVNIRLPLHVGELHDEFGTFFEIDARASIFEQIRTEQKDSTASVHEIQMWCEENTAHLRCTKKEVMYEFQCTVVMDAMVATRFYNGGRPIDVVTVINDLKLKNKVQHRFLNIVTVLGTRVEIPLFGTGEFRWKCHDNVTWYYE